MVHSYPFHGVYPILYAFFDARGQLDRAAMRRQVDGCLANGAHGIAVLGLATEVSKLSEAERHRVMEWVAEDVDGRAPLAITVYGNSVEQQVEYVRAAKRLGANWVILQPPPTKGLPESEYVRFFGAIMDQAELPVAIQNAPEYLGVGLSPAGLNTLLRNHANFTLLKGEGPVLVIRRVIEETAGKLAIFNGRGGLELPDNLRAGCAGMIPAPECFDRQARIYEL
ncbi:MAG: dihydrodipicolinate synthase family protein [Gammaproteobacteria bacterium]